MEVWRARIGTYHHSATCNVMDSHLGCNVTSTGVNLVLRLILISLLLRSGDIENNPGPDPANQKGNEKRITRQMTLSATNVLPSNEPDLNSVIQELRNLGSSLGAKMDRMSEDVNKKIDDLSKNVQEVKRDLNEAREQSARLTEENKCLKAQVNTLTDELDSMKGQMKRDNLIFHGLEQDKDETWEQSETKIKSFITERLDIDGDSIGFDRVHRLSNARKRPQPIIAKFTRYKQRDEVYRAAKILKDSGYKVTEDFTYRVRQIRRKLGVYLLQARSEGKKAFLSYDKLKIEGATYAYDFELGDKRLLSEREE